MYLGKNSAFLSQLPSPSDLAAFGDSDSVFSYIVDGLTSEMMSHSQEMPLSIKGIWFPLPFPSSVFMRNS